MPLPCTGWMAAEAPNQESRVSQEATALWTVRAGRPRYPRRPSCSDLDARAGAAGHDGLCRLTAGFLRRRPSSAVRVVAQLISRPMFVALIGRFACEKLVPVFRGKWTYWPLCAFNPCVPAGPTCDHNLLKHTRSDSFFFASLHRLSDRRQELAPLLLTSSLAEAEEASAPPSPRRSSSEPPPNERARSCRPRSAQTHRRASCRAASA